MATEWSSLIPEAVARDVIAAAEDESAVLGLGNVVVMPSGVMNVPVVSVAPSAVFVATGGRKPTSTIEWTAETLQPEEIALTLYIPDAYLDDAGFPVWESVRTEVAKAIGKTLDAAVLYGVGAPASYPTGGIAALAGAAQSGTDALEAIDAAATAIEATGLVPDGIIAGAAIGSALRAAYREVGALPSTVPEQTIYGMPVRRTPAWDPAQGDALVGDFSKLLVGIREDISFDLSDSATLTDGAGNVVISAFEADVTAMRAFLRVAVAIAQPVQPDGSGTVSPFSFADWSAVTAAGAEAPTRARSRK
jgi:Phage capsid family